MAFEDICAICGETFERGEQGVLVKSNTSNFNKAQILTWAHTDCLEEYNENTYVQLKLFR